MHVRAFNSSFALSMCHHCLSDHQIWSCSSVLNEANLGSILSESLSAKQEVVLSDQTEVAAGDSAGAGILAVLSWVRLKLMWHVFENE